MISREIPVFYSAVIVPKFKGVKLDEASIHALKSSGFNELVESGVALEAIHLSESYSVVIFPKSSPSRPYEIMIMVLPDKEGLSPKTTFSDFSPNDAHRVLQLADRILSILKQQAENNHHAVTDGYVYQHFNPHDLSPKTSFNGSVSHLHLHIQVYGHSLLNFPHTFSPSSSLDAYEAASRLHTDSGAQIFFEMFKAMFPEISVEVGKGSISFNNTDDREILKLNEVILFQDILKQWSSLFKEFSDCFLASTPTRNNSQNQLLSAFDATENVLKLCSKYHLSSKSRKILIFLAKNLLTENPNTWRNLYQGPNGAIGLHVNFLRETREWRIAPRIFRSWSRHLPLVSADQQNLEWTTKNESGDGLVNVEAQREIFAIQKKAITDLRTSLEKNPI